MAASAISGDYVDIKFVKSRKVACITIEIAMEAADDFLAKFGAPRPAEGVPVALARLLPGKAEEPVKVPRRMGELPFPQQAALLCDREAFRAYLRDRQGCGVISDAEDAAAIVRHLCGVESRSEIRPGTPAAATFLTLRGEFDVWMRAVA